MRTSSMAAATLVLALAGCSSSTSGDEWRKADEKAAGGSVSDTDFSYYEDMINKLCEQPTSVVNDRLLKAASDEPVDRPLRDTRMAVGLRYVCPDRLKDVWRTILK